jgi:hypothetical protein
MVWLKKQVMRATDLRSFLLRQPLYCRLGRPGHQRVGCTLGQHLQHLPGLCLRQRPGHW